jgi:hypothetical protein
VTVDSERTLVVARGPPGEAARSFYDASRTRVLGDRVDDLVPPEVKTLLEGCRIVNVLARAPVHGRPGLLPNDVAWRYLGATPSRTTAAPGGIRRHLVVQEVKYSSARRPEMIQAWSIPGTGDEIVEHLRLEVATPSWVLERMASATDVTLITHGVKHPDSDEVSLILAPERREDGTEDDALSASDIQNPKGPRLHGNPLVVLVTCQGARPAPVLHEPRSLPAAFLRAGARAVLAASDPVPSDEGPPFFDDVRARIHARVPPAEALRDARVAWLARDPTAKKHDWVKGVLLFE